MRTATFTLDVTPNAPRPPDSPRGAFAGFRMTVTKPDESTVVRPPSMETIIRVGNFIEGGAYTVRFEAVDDAGAVIQALADLALTVPAAPVLTYSHMNGVSVTWE